MTNNRGHGHVFPRMDGFKARCGGPTFCEECAADHKQLQATEDHVGATLAHQYIDPHSVSAMAFEAMKNQMLIVMVNRLGGKVTIPVDEVDGTGAWMMKVEADPTGREFTFETKRKD